MGKKEEISKSIWTHCLHPSHTCQNPYSKKNVTSKYSRHFSYYTMLQKQQRDKVEFVGHPFQLQCQQRLTEQSLFLIPFLFGQFDPLLFLSTASTRVCPAVNGEAFFWDNFQVKEKGFTLEWSIGCVFGQCVVKTWEGSRASPSEKGTQLTFSNKAS